MNTYIYVKQYTENRLTSLGCVLPGGKYDLYLGLMMAQPKDRPLIFLGILGVIWQDEMWVNKSNVIVQQYDVSSHRVVIYNVVRQQFYDCSFIYN